MTVATLPTTAETTAVASKVLADTYNKGEASHISDKVAGFIARSVDSHKNDLEHLAHDVADVIYDVYHSNLNTAFTAARDIFLGLGMTAQAERLS